MGALTNAEAAELEARDIRRQEDWWDRVEAQSVAYDEMSPEQSQAEFAANHPLLYPTTRAEAADDRDDSWRSRVGFFGERDEREWEIGRVAS